MGSTNINGTRDVYVNVLKAPAITLTIDGEPVADGATKSYEEGVQLELRCGAEGGVPDEIRSYTWRIGDTTFESNSATMSYTASRADNNMMLICAVDHRALDDNIYNTTFITPVSVDMTRRTSIQIRM